MSSYVFASGSAFPHRRFPRRNSRAKCSSQTTSAQTATGQQIKWWQTKIAASVGGVTAAGAAVATAYKVIQQWHRVDKLAVDVAPFKEHVDKRFDGVDKRFDGVDKRLDRQTKKLDKILELLEMSNKQHTTTREQFVKVRRRMDKTDLRVSVLEKNV